MRTVFLSSVLSSATNPTLDARAAQEEFQSWLLFEINMRANGKMEFCCIARLSEKAATRDWNSLDMQHGAVLTVKYH